MTSDHHHHCTDEHFLDRMAVLRKEGHLAPSELSFITARLAGAGKPMPAVSVVSDRALRLRRSRGDRWLGGVCGGIAARLGVESWVLRMLTVLAVLWFGTGALVYMLAWLFVPREAASTT